MHHALNVLNGLIVYHVPNLHAVDRDCAGTENPELERLRFLTGQVEFTLVRDARISRG